MNPQGTARAGTFARLKGNSREVPHPEYAAVGVFPAPAHASGASGILAAGVSSGGCGENQHVVPWTPATRGPAGGGAPSASGTIAIFLVVDLGGRQDGREEPHPGDIESSTAHSPVLLHELSQQARSPNPRPKKLTGSCTINGALENACSMTSQVEGITRPEYDQGKLL